MIGYRVISEIERPSEETIEKIKKLDTTLLADGAVTRIAMDHRIKQRVGRGMIVGPAFTVKLPIGDSLLSVKALELAKEGDIIVIDALGTDYNAIWGDMKSLISKKRKLGGVIIDGSMRDIVACREIGFPIFCKNIVCAASNKNSPGEINVSISCGNLVVKPGDIVAADENGVVVVAKEDIDEVIVNAEKKKKLVANIITEINKGNYITKKINEKLRALGYK